MRATGVASSAQQLADAGHVGAGGGEVGAAEVTRRQRVQRAALGAVEQGRRRYVLPRRLDGEAEALQGNLHEAGEAVAEQAVQPALVAQPGEVDLLAAAGLPGGGILGAEAGGGLLHPAQQGEGAEHWRDAERPGPHAARHLAIGRHLGRRPRLRPRRRPLLRLGKGDRTTT
ncbi:MAG TPA: hypothetical protein VGV61_18390 [Thermoanaerobaculia bacterium]|jgi:hypothetical protein|nr:hypothetical protein [Thermoanaerobaculia bacterium]